VKAERRQEFIGVNQRGGQYDFSAHKCWQTRKLDKGCIVFNLRQGDGYLVSSVDHNTKGEDAQYWKSKFLQIQPIANSYQLTKALMNSVKDYVLSDTPREKPIDKSAKLDLLNRSAEYFKSHDTFSFQQFEDVVFQEAPSMKGFKQFSNEQLGPLSQGSELPFDISTQAVKRYAKTHKSVLKLDKNFHVYIHGNRDLIERGQESDGRKYYKLYFEEES